MIEKDIPKRIVGIRCENDNIFCEVEWEINENGVTPAQSFVSNTVLKETKPNMLSDYYESIIDNYL
jgi:hypothetical protein